MIEIYLARHGQNVDNEQGILNGHRDEPLTELGEAQARTTAAHITEAGLTFDAVYCSPLQRAHRTAILLSQLVGLPEPKIMPELIERDFGVMTGQPVSAIEAQCAPDIIKTATVTYFLAPAGAETFPDLLVRSQNILDIVQSRHHSGAVLLVTHGDIGKMIYATYYQRDWQTVLTDFHFGNCELLRLAPDCLPEAAHVFAQSQSNH